jgi:solute carrier family 34 (sodium-dependent phosphate cotransporter)
MNQQPPVEVQESPPMVPTGATEAAPPAPRKLPIWRRWHWYKLPLFFVSILLFILAITLMKDGAGSLTPLVRDSLKVDNFWDATGFGWLFSYVILSGSPVAGTALAFLEAGAVDNVGAYAMIVGSRLGGSFIVLFIGFIYVLRGRNRNTSLGMGLLSMTVAATMQVLAVPIGLPMVAYGWLSNFRMSAGGALTGLTDLFLDPISNFLAMWMPGWGLVLVGLALIMVSFNLFDRCLPEMTLRESNVSAISLMVYKPWVMFLLGCLVTLISMSVSISLGLLVPLSQRGLVRRENVIPYIMGANITTFIDTLLVALLLENADASTIVLAQMISLTAVAAIILLIGYRYYERMLLRFVNWVSNDNRTLVVFVVLIVITPLLLMFV